MAQNQQPPVEESDFIAAEDRLVLRQLIESLAQGTVAPIHELCDSLDEALDERIQSLLALPAAPESDLDRLADKLALSVLNWRQEKIGQLVGEVKQLFRTEPALDNADAKEMYARLNEWTLSVLSIHKAKSAMSAASRRKAED